MPADAKACPTCGLSEEVVRRVVREELNARDERIRREESERLYFRMRAQCVARGISTPVPPPWMRGRWS